jgi:hypothetical protein
MPLLALLVAVPVFAQRIAVPRAPVRAAVAFAPPASLPPSPLSVSPLTPSAPSLAPTPDASLPAPAAQAAAALPPDPARWDRQAFDAMYAGRHEGPKPWTDVPGSPIVAVGATLVDRRAPGARELLKTLVLPLHPPVIGLFLRSNERPINGIALGTQGIEGHRDAAPPGLETRFYGGYTLGLRSDGLVRVGSSGFLPAELTPRLLRNLDRYYGLTPAAETGWQLARRWWLSFWDGATS